MCNYRPKQTEYLVYHCNSCKVGKLSENKPKDVMKWLQDHYGHDSGVRKKEVNDLSLWDILEEGEEEG